MKKYYLYLVSILLLIIAIGLRYFNDSVIYMGIIVLAIILFIYRIKNKKVKDIIDNNNDLITFALATVLISVIMIVLVNFSISKLSDVLGRVSDYEAPVSLNASEVFDNTEIELSNQSFKSSDVDYGALIIKNNSNVILRNSAFSKEDGDSSNISYSNYYGLNALVLAKSGTNTKLNDCKFVVESKGTVALFVAGDKSYVEINDSTIENKSSNNSMGMVTTMNGSIKASNVTIKTKGRNSAAIATNDDSGSIDISNSMLETNAFNSPLFYVEGNINVDNTTGVSNASRMIILENNGSINLSNSTLMASGQGNLDNSDVGGIIISGDGESSLVAVNSSFNIHNKFLYYDIAPLFVISDTKTNIDLTNTVLSFGSSKLMVITSSEVSLSLSDEDVEGKIILDDDSSLNLSLVNSKYKGNISNSGNVSLKMDSSSSFSLTSDVYLDEFSNEDEDNSNIDSNGYDLYVGGKKVDLD